jgi:YD repeat-containing protein
MMGLGRLSAALKRSTIPGRIALIVLLLAAPKLVVPALHLLIPDARADSVTYAYDALGRVIQATDTTSGQAVFYGYDSAGNITSQQVVPVSTLAISGFSSDQGSPGSQLTIDGTGFSTTVSANTVTFNGVTATVVSATQTQLTVTVPAGATSGAISVNTSGSSVTSSTSIDIASGTGTPTISGFSPAGGGSGTQITIAGTNFAVSPGTTKVLFNGVAARVNAATPTSVTVTVPDDCSSGLIEAITPYGSATSTTTFVVPPAGHALSEVGTVQQVTENVSTGSFTGSTALTLVLFNGKQGDQYVRLAIESNLTSVSVIDPHGTVIASASSFPAMISLGTLRISGTYTVAASAAAAGRSIVVNAVTGQVGSADLSYGDLVGNNWAAVNVNYAQPAVLSFGGAAGQVTEIDIMRNFYSWTFSVVNPAGQTIWSSSVTSSTQTVTIPALPADGIYQLIMDPGFGGGSIQYIASVVGASTLTPGASVTTGAGPNSINGAAARIAFSGTAGQYVNINVSFPRGSSQVCDFYYVTGTTFNYLGGDWGGGSCAGNFSAVLGPLPATTTYYLFTYLNSGAYTTMNVNMGAIPSLSINASATSMALGGEFQIIDFAATAGQTVSLHALPTTCLSSWQLISPSNAMIGNGARVPSGAIGFGPLSAAGTYTLVLVNYAGYTFGTNSYPPPAFYDQFAYGPYSPWQSQACSLRLTSP